MWTLRYINGFGDLVEMSFPNLDEVQAYLEQLFTENGDGPFSFKLKWSKQSS
jgi:hypothetical protein